MRVHTATPENHGFRRGVVNGAAHLCLGLGPGGGHPLCDACRVRSLPAQLPHPRAQQGGLALARTQPGLQLLQPALQGRLGLRVHTTHTHTHFVRSTTRARGVGFDVHDLMLPERAATDPRWSLVSDE